MSFEFGELVVLLVSGAASLVAWWMRTPDPVEHVGLADDAASQAVRTLGLSVPFDRYWPVTGRIDGVAVEVEVVRADAANERELVVRVVDPVPAPLVLRREDRAGWLGADDLLLGEPRFDDLFRIQTRDPLTVRALFDAATRDAVWAAGELGAGFADDRLTLRARCAGWTPAQVTKAVRAVLRAHVALRDRLAVVRVDARAALNDLARRDRHAGVRLRALDHLVQGGLADRDTLRVRAEDVDPAVRLLAAHALGPEGHPALEKLVRTGSRTVRVRAAGHLAESAQLSPERLALVEDAFLGALDDEELVRTALLGLGRRGTARAVVAVRDLAAGARPVGGAAPGSELRHLAESVLATIRSRLDTSASGGVSLAQEAGGDVALADPTGAGGLTEPR